MGKRQGAYPGLIFDLDGVIADTAKYHYLAWKEIASKLGIDFGPEQNERLKGVSRERSFEIVLECGHRAMPKNEQQKYCERKNEIYLSYIRKMGADEILPGVRAFLDLAREQGYRIALGSASKNAQLILERLGITGCFDAIVDGTKVTRAKPDPAVFVRGAKELGLSCAQCVVFEDSEAGMEAAHRGGMKGVGVGSPAQLKQADIVIPGFLGVTPDEIEAKL